MSLPSFLYRWPRASALAIGLLAGAALAAAFELALRRGQPVQKVEPFGCHAGDAAGVYAPDCRTRYVLRVDGRLEYDAPFSSDAIGRRTTPQSAPAERTRLAVFTGCSFTAGVGVADDETLPSAFAADAPGFRVLNYGVESHGPQHTLLQLERRMGPEEIGPYEGKALLVYTLIPSHISRAAGGRRIIGGWGAGFPSYALGPDGSLVLEGPFREAHPWRTAFARFTQASALLKRLPDGLTPADVELTAQILATARTRFRARFGSDRFVVLAYPSARSPIYLGLLARLRELGVAVVLPEFGGAIPGGAMFADGHPKPEAYRRVATQLVAALRGMGWLSD